MCPIYDYTVANAYYGIDWIYSYGDVNLAFDFVIKYFYINNSFYGFFSDVFFNLHWFNTFVSPNASLLSSIYLDLFEFAKSYNIDLNSLWYRSVVGPHELGLFISNTPEIMYFSEEIKTFCFDSSASTFFSILHNNELTESLATPVFLFFQLLFIIYIVSMFSILLFAFFGSHTTEENLIDHDYTLNSLIVESEEEIGSVDDMLMSGIIFFFVFGWFFYFNVFMVLTWIPETSLIVYLFPAVYYIIICIPTFLLYDFGIFFLSYLRGVGPSSVVIFELVFDYIAFMAFYIRLCVQGVRLILMTFVYVSLHDLVLLTPVHGEIFLGNESILDSLSNLSLTYESFSYFFFSKLPTKILYWIYELGHTFFVVTAQFIAFFAMVFWLFFFLYTFFVFEKFENHFNEKRQERASRLASLWTYK